MLHKLSERSRDEKGFTLIELLVVILIIGILAAIALPAFLGQRAKGQDSSAKSDARNLVSEAESCYTTTQDYSKCTTVVADSGLPAATNSFTGTATGYTIVSTSASKNTFTITKVNLGSPTRTCNIPAGGTAKGGCATDGGTW